MRTNVLRFLHIPALLVAASLVACGDSDDEPKPTPAPTEPSLSQILEDYTSSVVEIVVSGPEVKAAVQESSGRTASRC